MKIHVGGKTFNLFTQKHVFEKQELTRTISTVLPRSKVKMNVLNMLVPTRWQRLVRGRSTYIEVPYDVDPVSLGEPRIVFYGKGNPANNEVIKDIVLSKREVEMLTRMVEEDI